MKTNKTLTKKKKNQPKCQNGLKRKKNASLFLAKFEVNRKIQPFQRCPHLQCKKASLHSLKTWLLVSLIPSCLRALFPCPCAPVSFLSLFFCFSFSCSKALIRRSLLLLLRRPQKPNDIQLHCIYGKEFFMDAITLMSITYFTKL